MLLEMGGFVRKTPDKRALARHDLPGRAARLALRSVLGQETHLHGKTNQLTARPKPELLGNP